MAFDPYLTPEPTFATTNLDPSVQIDNLALASKTLSKANAHEEAEELVKVIGRIRQQCWPEPKLEEKSDHECLPAEEYYSTVWEQGSVRFCKTCGRRLVMTYVWKRED